MDKLKGKKIVNIYHDSAYGKETIPVLDAQAKKYGFTVTHIPVPHPGNEQGAQWLQIRQIKPDWVILRGWGVMNPVALKAAAKVGFPRDQIIGVWWSGAEEDTIPAGDAAKGYIAAGFNVAGTNFPVVQDIKKYVYAKGKGEMEDQTRIGSDLLQPRRRARHRDGRGDPQGAGEVRQEAADRRADPLGPREPDDQRSAAKELGAAGFMQPLKVTLPRPRRRRRGASSSNGTARSGSVITDWITPDRELVRPMIEESAAAYAKEKNITPRDCSKES